MGAALTRARVAGPQVPPRAPHRSRDGAVHLVASLVLTFGKLGATGALLGAAGFGPRHVTSTIDIPLNYVTYWAILGVVWTVDLMRQQRAARLRASELEASLATSRLDALALQLQPHFLFNTLNSVAELMHENVDAAERMVAGLSRLLRASLDGPTGHEVSLDQELAFLDEYLGIERIRFEERLRVALRIDPRHARVSCLACCCSRSSKTPSSMPSRPAPPAVRSQSTRRSRATV